MCALEASLPSKSPCVRNHAWLLRSFILACGRCVHSDWQSLGGAGQQQQRVVSGVCLCECVFVCVRERVCVSAKDF